MTEIYFKDPRKSNLLYEHDENLDFFIQLHKSKKFPKVLMVSGEKGIGKFTLINHFLVSIFDKDSYDFKVKSFKVDSSFYKQYLNNTFSNIIYLQGDNFKNIKIDDIRELKSLILKSSFSNLERYIIFDNIENFNNNSLNALLRIIEEPLSNNNFILINNKTKPLLKTIYSRCVDIKISLSEKKRVNIIKTLIEKDNLKTLINYETVKISPGNFLIFNDICEKNSINLNDGFIKNLNIIIKLFKKNKDINLLNFILFLNDLHFSKLFHEKPENLDKIFEDRFFVVNNMNKFISHNLNQNSFINAVNYQLSNE